MRLTGIVCYLVTLTFILMALATTCSMQGHLALWSLERAKIQQEYEEGYRSWETAPAEVQREERHEVTHPSLLLNSLIMLGLIAAGVAVWIGPPGHLGYQVLIAWLMLMPGVIGGLVLHFGLGLIAGVRESDLVETSQGVAWTVGLGLVYVVMMHLDGRNPEGRYRRWTWIGIVAGIVLANVALFGGLTLLLGPARTTVLEGSQAITAYAASQNLLASVLGVPAAIAGLAALGLAGYGLIAYRCWRWLEWPQRRRVQFALGWLAFGWISGLAFQIGSSRSTNTVYEALEKGFTDYFSSMMGVYIFGGFYSGVPELRLLLSWVVLAIGAAVFVPALRSRTLAKQGLTVVLLASLFVLWLEPFMSVQSAVADTAVDWAVKQVAGVVMFKVKLVITAVWVVAWWQVARGIDREPLLEPLPAVPQPTA